MQIYNPELTLKSQILSLKLKNHLNTTGLHNSRIHQQILYELPHEKHGEMLKQLHLKFLKSTNKYYEHLESYLNVIQKEDYFISLQNKYDVLMNLLNEWNKFDDEQKKPYFNKFVFYYEEIVKF
jgi:CRISPR/Cas system CSM-associated protein Csm2 small subunit